MEASHAGRIQSARRCADCVSKKEIWLPSRCIFHLGLPTEFFRSFFRNVTLELVLQTFQFGSSFRAKGSLSHRPRYNVIVGHCQMMWRRAGRRIWLHLHTWHTCLCPYCIHIQGTCYLRVLAAGCTQEGPFKESNIWHLLDEEERNDEEEHPLSLNHRCQTGPWKAAWLHQLLSWPTWRGLTWS